VRREGGGVRVSVELKEGAGWEPSSEPRNATPGCLKGQTAPNSMCPLS